MNCKIDCNNCKNLIITESVQQAYNRMYSVILPHHCIKYNRQVYHLANYDEHSPRLYPCDECDSYDPIKSDNDKEDKGEILKTEYSEKFDDIRKNMMIMSYYKYGPVKDNYNKYKCMNAVENLKIRLQKYLDTGNTEYLADVANFAMLEFMNPQVEGAHYKPTDNPDCELSGFCINEIRNFDK